MPCGLHVSTGRALVVSNGYVLGVPYSKFRMSFIWCSSAPSVTVYVSNSPLCLLHLVAVTDVVKLLTLMLMTCVRLCSNQLSRLWLLCIHVGYLIVVMKSTYLTLTALITLIMMLSL